jgi:nitrite reductase/ring-hydroxylating ferredoxin subunit
LSENYKRAIAAADIAPGGMKAVKLEGREIVVCNCGGGFYAVSRACGHANARLELGTLDGRILTCPLHYAQFDVTTGEALCGAVPPYPANDAAPAPDLATKSLNTYPVKIEDGWVLVAL